MLVSEITKQRLEASVRRAIRLSLYTTDDHTLSQLAADTNDNLFANIILHNPHHVLHKLLPGKQIIPTILGPVVILCH